MARKRRTLSEEELAKVEAMASVGATRETCAKRLGVDRRTFYAILKRSPRASGAFEAGRAEMESELVGALYRQATDPKNKNPTPAIFLLKAMRNFIDNPQPPAEETRVKVEVRLPAPLDETAYKQLLEVTPKAKQIEAGVVDG